MRKHEFIKDTDENGSETISVSDKPKRRLDLFPRLICVIIAFIVWIWMVNMNDTDLTESFVIKIQLVGQDVLEDNNMMVYGLDKQEITVTVKGANRNLQKYEADEYKAIVDVSELSEANDYTLPITITTPDENNLTVVESAHMTVSFKIDYVEEKEITYDVLASNAQDSGLVRYSYEYQFVDGTDNKIIIKGPKALVTNINSARLNVDGSFAFTSDEMLFEDFSLSFLDKNLNPINIGDSSIEYSTEEMSVLVKAIAHKEIDVKVIILNEGKGLVARPDIKTVEIWGAPSLVKAESEYVIELDKAELDKKVTHTITGDLLGEGVFVKEGVITIEFSEQ